MTQQVWIFGAGGFARRLREDLEAAGLTVIGFLSSRTGIDEPEVTSLVQVQDHSVPVYIGVFNHLDDPKDIETTLRAAGFSKVITPPQYFLSTQSRGADLYYLSRSRSKMPSNSDIKGVFEILADDESRRVLKGITDYQREGDIGSLVRSAPATLQYLGTTLPVEFRDVWLTERLRWIDVGAYDGDTIRNLKGVRGDKFPLDEFLSIEPDSINFQKLVDCTNRMGAKSINVNAAAGSENGWLGFDSSGLLSSKAGVGAQTLVPQITLDDLAGSWQPTHVKMDIEGAELDALAGGIRTLRKSRPRLAISIYHKPLDPVQIPMYLSGEFEQYSWYVRCYGAHGYDTVVYGVPKEAI